MQKSRVEQAMEKRRNGYNCAQAVVCTYCDLLGMSEREAFRASEGFGLGISGTMETCGAVCGMILLAGLKNSDANLETPASKKTTYSLGRDMIAQFRDRNTSVLCRDLRGEGLRSCVGCVTDAAIIVEETLFHEEFLPYDGPEESCPRPERQVDNS